VKSKNNLGFTQKVCVKLVIHKKMSNIIVKPK